MSQSEPVLTKRNEKLMTPKDVALRLDVHYRKVMELIKAGDIPAYRIGNQYRIKKEALDKYINNNAVTVPTLY